MNNNRITHPRGRIAMVVHTFPKLSETFIVKKFLGLLQSGWDVYIVCQHFGIEERPNFPDLFHHAVIRGRILAAVRGTGKASYAFGILQTFARCLVVHPLRVLRYLDGDIAWAPKHAMGIMPIDCMLISLAPDIVHFEFGTIALDHIHLKRLTGCRIVTSFRGYDLNYVGLESPDVYASVWRDSDMLHFLGNDLWRRAQIRGCPPQKGHRLIPPAIDASFFDPGSRGHVEIAGTVDRPLRILSVGRLEWKKGYEYAIQAVRFLLDCGVECHYDIVGGGAYLEAVTFACKQMAVEGNVRLLGPQAPAVIRQRMLEVDVFLHAAVSEGFCNAVLEAQAMRLPVVCTDADGLSENVWDGQTGFVVPRRNPEAMASKLELLARQPGLRERFGVCGRKRVLQDFRIDQQIDRFDAMYGELLSAGTASQPDSTSHT